MIAIIKVDSADFINRLDTEKFKLRMIPSTRIKFDSEDVKFYEPIFYNDVEVIDEPPEPYIAKSQLPEYFWDYIQNCIATNKFPTEEQLNPDNYLLKSDMPDFYWKFSKYALSKPANILPDSFNNLCNLAQAIPKLINNNQVFNWSKTPSNELRLQAYNAQIFITSDGYYFPHGCSASAYTLMNFRGKFEINSIVLIPNKTQRNVIASFYNPANGVDPNYRGLIELNKNVFTVSTRRSTVAGLAICATTLPSTWDNTTPVTIKVNGEWDTDNNELMIDTYIRYSYITDGIAYTTFDTNRTFAAANQTPGLLLERIGSIIIRNSGATVNTTISGNKYLQKYQSIDYTTNNQTLIEFAKSNAINQKLITIV